MAIFTKGKVHFFLMLKEIKRPVEKDVFGEEKKVLGRKSYFFSGKGSFQEEKAVFWRKKLLLLNDKLKCRNLLQRPGFYLKFESEKNWIHENKNLNHP